MSHGQLMDDTFNRGYRAGLLFAADLCEKEAKVYDGQLPTLHRCLMARAVELRHAAANVPSGYDDPEGER